ncbi:MAG: radical SAM protein [Minicystis sp.]
MHVAEMADYARAFLSAKFLGARVPLVVSMVVTNRCNFSCGYCDRWDGRGPELSTGDITAMLDEMGAMGTRRIIFTGGEPLLRKDMPALVARAKALGMKVNLNSNGTPVPRLMDQIRGIDTLTISLDGDEATHDRIRGKGAFAAGIAAVRAAKQHPHITVRFTAVISRDSIGSEASLLDVARREGVRVFFQPAEHRLLGSDMPNPLAPPIPRYRETIDYLLGEKARGAPIANSVSALRYLRDWPTGAALPCAGARLFCRVDYDGRVMICGRMGEYEESYSALTLGFRAAFLRLHEARCPTCWCGSRVEVNQAFGLRADALLGLGKGGG